MLKFHVLMSLLRLIHEKPKPQISQAKFMPWDLQEKHLLEKKLKKGRVSCNFEGVDLDWAF